MRVYEYVKKFLHKNKKTVELNNIDLLKIFKEEVSNELSVKELKTKQDN